MHVCMHDEQLLTVRALHALLPLYTYYFHSQLLAHLLHKVDAAVTAAPSLILLLGHCHIANQ